MVEKKKATMRRKRKGVEFDWDKIWEEFGRWHASQMKKINNCPRCRTVEFKEPDWELQKAAIQRIVKKHTKLKAWGNLGI